MLRFFLRHPVPDILIYSRWKISDEIPGILIRLLIPDILIIFLSGTRFQKFFTHQKILKFSYHWLLQELPWEWFHEPASLHQLPTSMFFAKSEDQTWKIFPKLFVWNCSWWHWDEVMGMYVLHWKQKCNCITLMYQIEG